MLAYKNDPALKSHVVEQAEIHQEADAVRQRFYGEGSDNKIGFAGCSVGCLIHIVDKNAQSYSDYRVIERKLGIPKHVSVLDDVIHEGLSREDSKLWLVQYVTAIQTGSDLSDTFPRFVHRILTDPENGFVAFCEERAKRHILATAALYECWIDGDMPTDEEWNTVRDGAISAISDIRAISAISDIRDISDIRAIIAISDISDISDIRAISAISDISAIRDIRDISAISAIHFAWMRDVLLDLLRNAPIPETLTAEQ